MFLCLIFIFLSIGLIFIGSTGYIIGILGLIISGGVFLYFLIKLITDKNYFKERYKVIRENSYLNNFAHPFKQDIDVMKIIKKNISFIIPFIISVFLIVIFLIFEFRSFFILSLIKNLKFGFWIYPIYFYILSFICFSFYILGYLSLGEILQRRFLKVNKNFIFDMIINYVYSIPFIAILSLIWVILLFIKDEKSKNIPSSFLNAIKLLSIYGLFIILKYYTYTNLAIIALEDKYKGIPFKESFQYLKKERTNLFFIWFRSGALVAFPFLIIIGLGLWNLKFQFMNTLVLSMLFFSSLVLFFFWGLLSEQLSFLFYFLKSRHKDIKL